MVGIAVFAKYPEPGLVKTRLAATLGAAEAAHAYVRLLGHLLERTLRPLSRDRFSVTLFCDPVRPREAYEALLGFTGFPVRLQEGNDLGARLVQGLGAALEGAEGAIAVGTDCIDLTPALLEETASRLGREDVVLGPSTDGGYYLIGLKRVHGALFEDVPWSTGRVAELTLRRAREAGLQTGLLKALRDVDEEADWREAEPRCDRDNAAIRNLLRRRTSPG